MAHTDKHTDKQTNRQTSGHGDSMTDPAQSVLLYVVIGFSIFIITPLLNNNPFKRKEKHICTLNV